MRAALTPTLSLAACLVVMGAVAADPARISVDSPGVAEGDDGTATLEFTVTRSGETGSTVALRYQTDDDTARAPGDYRAIAPSMLTFASGQTQATVPVTINGDVEIEADETLFLHLTFLFSYAAARTFDAGDGAVAVTALDVNGDGRPDLAVANLGGDSVSVLLNITEPGADTASFAGAADFAVGNNPAAVTATDVNGDGLADLVVANGGDDSVSVLLNATAPGADAPSFVVAGAFAAGNNPGAVAATDLNGDGRPDLAVANIDDDSVSVLLNITAPGADTASFAGAGEFAAGNGPRAVAATDVNGDGRPDLVVASSGDDSVSVLLNTTAPGADAASYAGASEFAVGDSPRAVVATDVNGDGRPDLVVANSGDDSVSVLLNTTAPGADTASYAAAGEFGAGDSPRSVAVTDVDGDGRPDLAVANAGDDSVSVLLNTTVPGADAASYAAASELGAGDSPRAVVATDADGDGRPDLVVANAGDDSVSVLLNQPAVLDGSEGTGTLRNDDFNVTPAAFQFEDQADVELDSIITSAAVTISGIDAAARIEVSGGAYSVGCTTSFRTSSSTIVNGRTVCVRHTSSEDFDSATHTRLTIGGISDTFTSITLGRDTTPDAFAFTDKDNALLNSPQVSDTVTLRGFRNAAPISVTGGEYSRGCTGTFTGAAGTIESGDTVCVRHTSSATHATATHTTLTVGGVSDTFTSTTPAEQDFSQTGALALLDVLLGLLAALGFARRQAKKIRSLGCPCERIL